jgi:hypothetical protein
MRGLLILWLCATPLMSGCVSPEARRTRGGGPGADGQNRPAHVKMHEGSQQFWETPQLIEANHPPLDPAQNARLRSLP